MTDFYVQKGHGGTDSGTEANPFLTIDQGMNAITTAGAGPHNIYVQTPVSGDYEELATVDTVGTQNAGVAVIGFDSTITEIPPVQVTIDGSSASNFGFATALTSSIFYHFANFIVQNSTGSGFSLTGADNISYFNCVSDNNSNGFLGDNNCSYLQCVAKNNTTDGFDGDNATCLHSCHSFANGNDNVVISFGAVVNTLAYGLTGSGDNNIASTAANSTLVAGCTIDGEGVAGVTGIDMLGSSNSTSMIVNNIIYDCDAGVDMNGSKERLTIAAYNLVNSNTSDYNSEIDPIPGTDVSGAPQFTDESGDDYSLASGSPAIDAGSDAGNI